jgi:glycosyltransferase involved in cell wall biosynthesis
MRIAINAWFLDRQITGSGEYLRNLMRAMPEAGQGHRFLLVTPRARPNFAVPQLEHEFWSLRAPFWSSRLGKVLFEQVAFPRICHRWGADLAHVPYWGSPLRPSVPTLVTIHDLIPWLLPEYRGSILVRLYTRLVAASARKASLVLTDSLASKRDIEEYLHLPSRQVHCVYLAASEHLNPEPMPDDQAIRYRYRLPRRYILYLAGHDVRKNVSGLLKSFAIVMQADDDVTLVIGGQLPPRTQAPLFDPRPLTAALGLEKNVRFIGRVDEAHKPALLRGATCAVFPSRYEGFGLPVLEALACGTPLITTSASSLPELVGDAGFALDPDDLDGMAGAILACLVDESLVAELRRRGPKQAAQFSWARTARETVALYKETAGTESVREVDTCAS